MTKCGKWMPVAKEECARSAGHKDYCWTRSYLGKRVAYSAERRGKLAEAGLCWDCEKEPVAPGKNLCKHHTLMKSLRGHPGRDAEYEAKDLQKLREMQ